MKSMKKTLLLLSALAPLSALASDPGAMRPGQYEYTMKMEIPGMPFQMPPTVTKHCVTPEEVKKDQSYQSQSKDCKTENFKQMGSKVSYDFTCTGKTPSTGHYDLTVGPTGFEGTGTTDMGDGQQMKQKWSAKRLGDCP